MSTLTPDPGSFRDPSSRVFPAGDRVLRALSAEASGDLAAVEKSSFFRKALERRQVIGTTRLTESPAELGLPDHWAGVVEHPRLPLWTYPYEWSFTMLQDAALLQLELLTAALAEDFVCKDSTPYNIQFTGGRPMFIDIGSFERLGDGEPWYGYLQFCQMFLYPLLFQAYVDLPFQPWLRAAIDGITPEDANKVIGPTRLTRKGVLIHVALHARAAQRFASSDADIKSSLKKGGFNKKLIEANANGLHRLISGLRWKRSESTWSAYSDRGHYTEAGLKEKEAFVTDVVTKRPRSVVWDVGCNDGHFSRLVAPHTTNVLAMDLDHLVVDMLYRDLKARPCDNIVPVVLNLADPSPGLGWRGLERTSFLDRNRPDVVLCLAVVHHLAITNNVPTSEFLDLLVALGAEAVVEFPTEDDPMVKQLLRNKRAGVHDQYSLANFEKEVQERFTVEHRVELDSHTRVLFHLSPA